jgi:uncharacterized membrane protein
MTKRRRHSRKPKKLVRPNTQDNPTDFSWIKRLSIFGISNLILMTVVVIYNWRHGYTFSFIYELPLPIVTLYLMVFILSLSILNSMVNKLQQSMPRMKTDTRYARKSALILMSYSLLPFGLLCMPLIYSSGIVNTLAIYLHSRIPALGEKFYNLFLSFLTMLISGIIGNAAYDLLKRIGRRFRKT